MKSYTHLYLYLSPLSRLVVMYCRIHSATAEPNDEASNVNYKYGDSIITRLAPSPSLRSPQPHHVARTGLLGIRQRSFYGQCSRTEPVRFLQDSSSSCVIPLTPDSCSASGSLSAQLYASSPRWSAVEVYSCNKRL